MSAISVPSWVGGVLWGGQWVSSLEPRPSAPGGVSWQLPQGAVACCHSCFIGPLERMRVCVRVAGTTQATRC